MESELRCPMCHEYFSDPVMLQCTHHICIRHMGSTGPRERLTCPVCGDVTIVPEGGLRVDRTLSVVVELWQQLQVPGVSPTSPGSGPLARSAERARQYCGFCEEKPATRRCIQCSGVLCEECEKSSHSKGFFKSHNIVDLDGGLSSVDYSGRMLCDEHPEEKLSFYCLDCRKPVCSHCLILGDHKGHQQTPVDQAFETGKETLGAWVEKLQQRITTTEDLLAQLREAELEVYRGAEAQRNIINSEMDHMRELIETKRHQLLSKSALEEKQKRVQLQAQVDKAEGTRQDAGSLVSRSQDLLSLSSEHAFLAVVLPLIQDMKKCASQQVDDGPRVVCSFRPLSTDAQVRSLGDLDLGHPRPPPQQHPVVGQALVGQPSSFMHGQATAEAPMASYQVAAAGFANASATVSYLPQQQLPVQSVPSSGKVQYVYRTIPAQ